MGISVENFTSAEAQYYGRAEGALVRVVEAGSCSEKAGLKVGDIITKLGDTDVTSTEDLIRAKKSFKAGDTTTITVNRDGEELELSITFDEEGVTQTASSPAVLPR
jgi:serine protease Do